MERDKKINEKNLEKAIEIIRSFQTYGGRPYVAHRNGVAGRETISKYWSLSGVAEKLSQGASIEEIISEFVKLNKNLFSTAGRRHKVGEEEREKILSLYASGSSVRNIGKLLNYSKRAVLDVLHKGGSDIQVNKKNDDQIFDIIRTFVDGGYSAVKTAKELSMSQAIILKYVKMFMAGDLPESLMSRLGKIPIKQDDVIIKNCNFSEDKKAEVIKYGNMSIRKISIITGHPVNKISKTKNDFGYLVGEGKSTPPADVIRIIKAYELYDGIGLQASKGIGLPRRLVTRIWKRFDLEHQVDSLGIQVDSIISGYIKRLKQDGKNTSMLHGLAKKMRRQHTRRLPKNANKYGLKSIDQVAEIIMAYDLCGGVVARAETLLGIKDSTIKSYWKRLEIKDKLENRDYTIERIVEEYKQSLRPREYENETVAQNKDRENPKQSYNDDLEDMTKPEDREKTKANTDEISDEEIVKILKGKMPKGIKKELKEDSGDSAEEETRPKKKINKQRDRSYMKDMMHDPMGLKGSGDYRDDNREEDPETNLSKAEQYKLLELYRKTNIHVTNEKHDIVSEKERIREDTIRRMTADFIERYHLAVDLGSAQEINDRQTISILDEKGLGSNIRDFVFSDIGKEILQRQSRYLEKPVFYDRLVRRFATVAAMNKEMIEKDIKNMLDMYHG